VTPTDLGVSLQDVFGEAVEHQLDVMHSPVPKPALGPLGVGFMGHGHGHGLGHTLSHDLSGDVLSLGIA
jgi:hypothetical protein